jgi:hypothetical protein
MIPARCPLGFTRKINFKIKFEDNGFDEKNININKM